MKVFITKYALTTGIFETDVEVFENSPTRLIRDLERWSTFYSHDEWHTSKEEAILMADKMREKKIASLKKKLIKLERLEF